MLLDSKTAFREALSRFFRQLEPDVIDQLVEKLVTVQVKAGNVLYRQGEPGTGMHVLLTGRMQVFLTPDTDADAELIGIRKSGDIIGEISLFTGCDRSATVIAARDSTLGYLSREDFDRLMHGHPHMKLDVARFIIDRLIQSQGRHCAAIDKKTTITVVPLGIGHDNRAFTSSLCASLQRFGDTAEIHLDTIPAGLRDKLAANADDSTSHTEHYLETIESQHAYVLLQSDAVLSHWTEKCLSFSDTVILVVPVTADFAKTSARARDILNAAKSTGCYSELVFLHSDDSVRPENTARWLAEIPADRHHHLRRTSIEGFERLARILSGHAISLVLSGGGARGFAHLGVIRALREIGIPIDMVGGASQGAIVAAGVAMGWDDEQMTREYKAAYVEVNPGNDYTLPVFSVIKGKKMSSGLQKHFGDATIEDLWISFFCISSNLSTRKQKIHRGGLLWRALRASASLPAILPPVIEDSEVLVDGSILNNLPVQVAKDLMGGYVIVIDTSPDDDFYFNSREIPAVWKYVLKRFFFPKRHVDIPTIERLVMKSAMLGSGKEAEAAERLADLYLSPTVDHFKMWEWHRLAEISEEGYRQCYGQLLEWSENHPELRQSNHSSHADQN